MLARRCSFGSRRPKGKSGDVAEDLCDFLDAVSAPGACADGRRVEGHVMQPAPDEVKRHLALNLLERRLSSSTSRINVDVRNRRGAVGAKPLAVRLLPLSGAYPSRLSSQARRRSRAGPSLRH